MLAADEPRSRRRDGLKGRMDSRQAVLFKRGGLSTEVDRANALRVSSHCDEVFDRVLNNAAMA